MKKLAAFSLALLFVLSANVSLAQIDLSEIPSGPELKITLSPEFPQPGDEVTAALATGAFGAEVGWMIGGLEINPAQNSREMRFTAGPAGETQTITAILNSPVTGQKTLNKEVVPLYQDIIVEPQTHVPSFYQGRSLASPGSMINATFIISGKEILDTDLVYKWRVGRDVIGNGPLRGRDTISFEATLDQNILLSVEASEPNGTLIAKRSVLVPSVQPTLLFYESNTLLGLKEVAIKDTLTLLSKSVIVRAEPYYLDSRSFNNPDIIDWSINGRTFNSGSGNPYEVTLETTGVSGRTTLELHVRDTENLLQGVKDSIDISL